MVKVINGKSTPLKSAPNFLIGESDFETYMLSDKVYVDKTRFIKKWWESGDKVTLIVRPRRFLKTSILSMVDKWFNCKDPKFIFSGTEILEIQTPDIESSREHLDSIFITLKNIDAKSSNTLNNGLKTCFRRVYFQYEDIYEEYYKKYGQNSTPVNSQEETIFILQDFVSFIEYLNFKTKKKFVILIDEYDKILMDAATKEESEVGYFNAVLDIYRNFLNSLLKDTPYVEKAILTGVLPLAANSVFSAFNNSVKDTFFDNTYEDIFGFTFDEIEVLTTWMEEEDSKLMLDFLDSYNSGSINLINPWSLINYIKSVATGGSRITNSWVTTGNSEWVNYKDNLTDEEINMVSMLLTGTPVTVPLNHELSFLDRTHSLSNYLSYAFYTGYLTFDDVTGETVSLRVPNKEVLNAWLSNINKLVKIVDVSFNWSEILEQLDSSPESASNLEGILQQLLEECASTWDLVNKENSYHMWILGLMSSLVGSHKVTSNREAGLGRFDIAVTPLSSKRILRNYVFELKKSDNVNALEKDVQSAIQQVKDNNYYRFFDNNYDIVIIGLSAYKKSIKVKIETFTRKELSSK